MEGEIVNTRRAAALLGMKPGTLSAAVWGGRLASPAKGPGGCLLWTLADLERAAWVFFRQSFEARQRELEAYAAAKATQGREVQP